MNDDELMEAWRRGELVVTDVDDETKARILGALDSVITNVSELDELPAGAIVLADTDDVDCVYVKWPEHYLASLYGPWFSTGCEAPCSSDEIPLPARLIWHPDWNSK
jgi:hypothetical protein